MTLRSNLAEFNADVKAFAERTKRDPVKIQRKLAMIMLRRVILKTPVDTGRARNNWQLSQGTPPAGIVESGDRGGNGAIQRGAGEIANIRTPTLLWLANNLPYIERLENGYSRQAPAGMLRATIEELRGAFG